MFGRWKPNRMHQSYLATGVNNVLLNESMTGNICHWIYYYMSQTRNTIDCKNLNLFDKTWCTVSFLNNAFASLWLEWWNGAMSCRVFCIRHMSKYGKMVLLSPLSFIGFQRSKPWLISNSKIWRKKENIANDIGIEFCKFVELKRREENPVVLAPVPRTENPAEQRTFPSLPSCESKI